MKVIKPGSVVFLDIAETIIKRTWTDYSGTFSADYPSEIEPFREWPRTEEKRIARMNRYVDWKRHKIVERRIREFGTFAAVMVGVPLFIALVAGMWSLALKAVL